MKKFLFLIICCCILLSPEGKCQLTTSLAAYYKLDEASGHAYNSVNTSLYTSTAESASKGISGKISNCFSFSGTSTKVTFADNDIWTIIPADNISISAWIYFNGDITNEYGTIFGTAATYSFSVQKLNPGIYRLLWWAGQAAVGSNNFTMTTGVWYHVVVTKTGTTAVNFYINGALNSLSTPSDITANPVANYIGGDENAGGESFNGRIDEVGFWKKALSASEVSLLNNTGYGITHPFVAPSAPTGLTATVASCSQVNLSWTDNSTDEAGFYIYRNGTQIASVARGVTSYSSTGLAASTAYSYYVLAYNSIGNSTNSNTSTVTTTSCTSVPTAPSGLTATTSSCSQVNLSWTDNSSNETGFKIYNSGGTLITTISTANTTTYSVTGLTASTPYSYYVVSYNGAGNSLNSNTASATTPACSTGSWQTNGSNIYYTSGKVSIGTTIANSASSLTVNGKILATEVEVVSSIAADYVFEPEYQLMPLTELEIYLKQNKHLPGIPSVVEFSKQGQNLGKMDDLLLRKIEELTLYVIQQDKVVGEQRQAIEELKKRLDLIQKQGE